MIPSPLRLDPGLSLTAFMPGWMVMGGDLPIKVLPPCIEAGPAVWTGGKRGETEKNRPA